MGSLQFIEDVIQCCVVQIVPEVDLTPSTKEPTNHVRLALIESSTKQSVLTSTIHMINKREAMLKQNFNVLDGPDEVQDAVVLQLFVTMVKCEVNRATLG
jgi:hypothetical protein